ncbi:MAG: hypothetical protein ACRC18_06835 [Cetobacterium sp.]
MIKQRREVNLYEPSKKYLDLFEEYGYKLSSKEIKKVKGKCVIHITPVKDTYFSNNEDDLNGFCDAILFKVRVCDCDNRIMYKPFDMLFDSIKIDNDVRCESRIYKDLSTMYIFDSSIAIDYGKTIWIEKDNK